MNEEYLCFVRLIGTDIDGNNTYEFLFSDNIEEFWFDGAEHKPLGLINGIEIDPDTYTTLKVIKTTIQLDLIQNSTCFGFQDCVDGIVAIAYESLDGYEEYPEDGRLVFHYGDSFSDVEELLAKKNILFE